jgi:hypothetical protein
MSYRRANLSAAWNAFMICAVVSVRAAVFMPPVFWVWSAASEILAEMKTAMAIALCPSKVMLRVEIN